MLGPSSSRRLKTVKGDKDMTKRGKKEKQEFEQAKEHKGFDEAEMAPMIAMISKTQGATNRMGVERLASPIAHRERACVEGFA